MVDIDLLVLVGKLHRCDKSLLFQYGPVIDEQNLLIIISPWPCLDYIKCSISASALLLIHRHHVDQLIIRKEIEQT
jgi:hypothetical protein